MEKASDYDVIVEAACKLLDVGATPDPTPSVQAARSCEIITPQMTVSVSDYPEYAGVFINHATSSLIQPIGENAQEAIDRIKWELEIANRDYPAYVEYAHAALKTFREKTRGGQVLQYTPDQELNLPGYKVQLLIDRERPVRLCRIGVEASGNTYVDGNALDSFFHKQKLKKGLYVFKCREVDNALQIDWRSDDCGYQIRNLSSLLQSGSNVYAKLRRFTTCTELAESCDGDDLPNIPEYEELMTTFQHVYLEFSVE